MSDKPTLTNEEIKAKRLALQKEIEYLNSKVNNPTAYSLKDGPYVNSEMHREDKVKLSKLLERYRALVNVYDEGVIVMDKYLYFSDGRYVLKYVPQKNRWDLYDGTLYMTSDVVFTDDGETAVATHKTQNSDMYGEIVSHVFTIKCKVSPDPIVNRAKPIPCTIIDVGLGLAAQDAGYWEKYGFVKDANDGRLRQPTTAEYDAVLKTKQVAKKETPKKKGFGLGSFLGGKKQ